MGREGADHIPDEAAALLADFVRRVGLAVGAARAYTRQATISRILQRGLLPSKVAEIPGVTSALVYEPSDDGVVGGDFYDLFPCPGGRWCFVLGDVQGSGPEAAVVTGLARPWLRLLSREGFRVGEVLDRLNRLLLDDAMEAAEAAALMVAAAGGQQIQGGEQIQDGSQSRFLSLLYGELVPLPDGGVRCTVASAGHPLPLLLRPDGSVRPAAEPQVLLGVVEDVAYESQSFDLTPGDSLLCVTDGVTERRSGRLMFDDGDGLARVLAGCAGLPAAGIAEPDQAGRPHLRRAPAGRRPGPAGAPGRRVAAHELSGSSARRATMDGMPSVLPDGEPVPDDGALPRLPWKAPPTGRSASTCTCPYCATRCGYCDFNTYTATELRGSGGALASRDNYAAHLVEEVRLARKVLGDDPRPVAHGLRRRRYADAAARRRPRPDARGDP